MADPIIRVEDLGKTYRSGESSLQVFAEVCFELLPGHSVSLVGESGTGKSTLLHLLGALDEPTAGEIVFRGRRYSQMSNGELAKLRNAEIGFVWQNYYLLPEFTALENVMMPLLIGGESHPEAEQAARRWLGEVGLAERTHHQAGELSGGEQQRVALARALVRTPSLLLADEPTGNLDMRTGGAIINLLTSLPGKHDLCLVIATHNLTFARRCGRIFQMAEGRLTAGVELP